MMNRLIKIAKWQGEEKAELLKERNLWCRFGKDRYELKRDQRTIVAQNQQTVLRSVRAVCLVTNKTPHSF